MPAFGLLLLLIGGLVLRQVAVGRARNIPEDSSAFFSALLEADTGKMQEVFAQRGTNVSADSASVVAAFAESADTTTVKGATTALMSECIRLGTNAQGYLLGGNGPSFYDCSGLVWRAAKNLGYNPPYRFTTSNFDEGSLPNHLTKVDTPVTGDIIVWRTHHMGMVTGTDKLYSARSASKGIGYSTISGDTAYFKMQPEYWRINA